MKKLSLSLQITLVFIFAFIITSIMIVSLVTNNLNSFYENNIYEKLEAEAKVLKQVRDITNYIDNEDISYIRYSTKDNVYTTSNNIKSIMSKSSIELLINKASSQEQASIRYINEIDNKEIYYVILNNEGFFNIQNEDILIVLTDSNMKSKMVRETTLQIVLISLAAFLIGYLLILLWVSKLVNDTKKISNALNDMGDNHYKNVITSDRKDEIGQLADNVEKMRIQIIENEKQKQEMVQGISHDLKTPVAIIQSYTEALSDGMCTKDETIEITLKECSRLNQKITKLLHLTRLNYVDIDSKKSESTDMEALLSETVATYQYLTKANISLELDQVYFNGDYESWQIVIENILDNAIRYAKDIIKVSLNQKNLSIYNDNSHIEESKLQNIFNFYEKSKDGNFGIGLSTVKRTVEMFGYEIKATNIENGVTFIIKEQ